MRRESVLLAHVWNPAKHKVAGWWVSEKLDGQRAFWDGGITRGKDFRSIPWANVDKKIAGKSYVATGLYTRYMNPIFAPDSWLDTLPSYPLDGELYLGLESWGNLRSIVSRDVPDASDWANVQFLVFDLPSFDIFLETGTVKTPNYTCDFDARSFKDQLRQMDITLPQSEVFIFDSVIKEAGLRELGKHASFHTQEQLSSIESEARSRIDELLDQVCAKSGEGLILRDGKSIWYPMRTNTILKVKPRENDTAVVVGYTWGKGKLSGLMGNVICKLASGVTFELSGFTDDERRMVPAKQIPSLIVDGMPIDTDWKSSAFPRGSSIPFRYRYLSKDGKPIEASYWRQ